MGVRHRPSPSLTSPSQAALPPPVWTWEVKPRIPDWVVRGQNKHLVVRERGDGSLGHTLSSRSGADGELGPAPTACGILRGLLQHPYVWLSSI